MTARIFTRAITVLVAMVSLWAIVLSRGASLLTQNASTTDSRRTVANFRLVDSRGHPFALFEQRDARVIVFVSFLCSCPQAVASLSEIEALRVRYGPSKVRLFLIDCQDTPEAVQRLTSRDRVRVPILIDDAQIVSRDLGFNYAPQALVVSTRDWSVPYRGPIETKVQDGRPPRACLMDAIDALLDGRQAVQPDIHEHGCPLGYDAIDKISYAHDIVPIWKRACLRCHRAIDALPLSNYEQLRKHAPMIRETLLTRRMPPFQADNHAGFLANRIALSARDMRLMVAWIDANTPWKSGHDPLKRAVTRGWLAETRPGVHQVPPDFVWQAPHAIAVPASGELPYLSMQVAGPLKHDLWVSRFELEFTDRAVVHHAILYLTTHPERYYKTHTLSVLGAIKRGIESTATTVSAYHPGKSGGSTRLRPGFAWHLPRGHYLILQLHYHGNGRPTHDRPVVKIWLCRHTPQHRLVLHTTLIFADRFTIPPGARAYVVRFKRIFQHEMLLLGCRPHMHLRGRAMKATLVYPNGRRLQFLSIPFYNFDYQSMDMLKKPLRMPPGSTIQVEAVFDNSAENANNPDPTHAVMHGTTTSESEMCQLALIYATKK